MTVKTVSSIWPAAAKHSHLRPGAAAALSQLRAGSDGSCGMPRSGLGIDPALVDDPGNAARQGDDNHAERAQDVRAVLWVAREHALADEETERCDDHAQHDDQQAPDEPEDGGH